MKGFTGVNGLEDGVFSDNASFDGTQRGGFMASDGQLWIGSGTGRHVRLGTLSAGTGISITNGPGTISIASTAAATDLHVARYIVASSTAGTGANFTTIAAAIAAAQGSGINSTIFIQPGTYTENLTLPAGINLCAFECDAFTPNVTIIGTITKTTAGSSSISGIRLQTNSAALLAVTGSAASIVNLNNCYLNCTNNTGITFSSSDSGSRINLTNCDGNLGTTGIAYFTHTSSGTITIRYGSYLNTGSSTTANTCSAGIIDIFYCRFSSPITTSSTSAATWQYVEFNLGGFNVTCATLGGSGVHIMRDCRFASGSASAVSIGNTTILEFCDISSSNTNAVTGAGTLSGNTLSFSSSSSLVNTTTQTPLVFGIQGTWTPNIQINSSSTGITYTTQVGTYTRIGSLVFLSAQVVLSSKGVAAGTVTISNLPVAAGASAGAQSLPIGWYTQVTAAGYTTLGLQFATSTVATFILSSASGSGVVAMANTHISDTFNFRLCGVYNVL